MRILYGANERAWREASAHPFPSAEALLQAQLAGSRCSGVRVVARWREGEAAVVTGRIAAEVVMDHWDGVHLPGRPWRGSALVHEGGLELDDLAVRHHHLGVAGKRHRRLLEADFGQIRLEGAQAVLVVGDADERVLL